MQIVDRMDRFASAALTFAALTMAAVIVRREFVASTARVVQASGPPTYEKRWGSILPYAIVVGDSSAPLKLVEFVDFECPACRSAHDGTIRDMQQRYSGKLAIWYVHSPLRMHRFARSAAQAAECADRVGKFGQFVDEVFAKQDSLGLKSWGSFGRDLGLSDTTAFISCVHAVPIVARIDTGEAVARREQVEGTPTFILNGWRFSSVPTPEEFTRVAEAVLAGKEPTR